MTTAFVTLDDAKNLAALLGSIGIGGGVKPYADDSHESGIYVPVFAGPFAVPADGDKKWYHFRFNNGAEGFNAGLIKGLMDFAPTRWPLLIATEVNAAVGLPAPVNVPQPPAPPVEPDKPAPAPAKPAVLVGDPVGINNWFRPVFGDDSPDGTVYEDARGKFRKVVYPNPFAPNGKSSYWTKL